MPLLSKNYLKLLGALSLVDHTTINICTSTLPTGDI